MNPFEISVTCHEMFGIQIETRTTEEKLVAQILKDIVLNPYLDTQDYQHSKKAGAFLQSYGEDFIMVEFWRDEGADEFIKYINEVIPLRYEAYRNLLKEN